MAFTPREFIREIITGKTKTPWERAVPNPYPDYDKSIVTQGRGDPTVSGLVRGAGSGLLAAVLTGLAARMATDDKNKVMLASVLGGLAGSVPGFISGSRERESENSKLLSYRRLGIDTPAELELSKQHPGLLPSITREGTRV